MATWTSIQLRDAVLEHLNIKARGDSAEPEDAQVVDDLYNSEYPGLAKLGLVQWAKDEIPDWAQHPLTLYLAGYAARKFCFSGQRLAEAMNDTRMGREKLYEQMASQDQGPPALDFF